MTTRIEHQDWLVSRARDLSDDFCASIGGHPLVARILAQRGFDTPETARAFLDPDFYPPALPDTLPDLIEASNLLRGSIATRKRVLVWGDFDVDGQTATALLLDGLRGLGVEVDFYIPNRLRESHGVQVGRLEQLIREKQPEILLTCDTGISAHEAVEIANKRGLTVIITDHHDLPPTLPPAAAVVNPKRLEADHPLRSLPGVGVAFKLMQALYTDAGREKDLDSLLDLVALGIVADVAEQTRDTRYLLQIGLKRLRATQRLGLRALVEAAGANLEQLSAEDIGFQLGPRLNAVGRLDDATQAVELLTTRDPAQARAIAARLEGLNKKRQVMQRQIFASAQEMIAAQPDLLDHAALVISHPEWHPGLLGVVAGQLAEQYGRPCLLLIVPPDEPLARGSARSVPGYDIGQALADQAEILDHFGGHPGAAGVALPVENITKLRRRLSKTLHAQKRDEAIAPLNVAAEINLDEVTPELADEIERLAPFGEGNPPVVLAASNLTLVRQRIIGVERRHRRLTVRSEPGVERPVLWWDGADHPLPDGPFDLAFTISQRVYKGERELALVLEGLRLLSPIEVRTASERLVEDWRARIDEPDLVETFRQREPDGVIWAECSQAGSASGVTRSQLAKAEALLIYTAPPSQGALQAALEQVRPKRVYLLGVMPDDQGTNGFLRRLAGLAKYTINHKAGRAEISRLAAASAQTEAAIGWGLRLLAARGTITLQEMGDDTALMGVPGETKTAPRFEESESAEGLRAALAESTAYRAFFCRAALEGLLE